MCGSMPAAITAPATSCSARAMPGRAHSMRQPFGLAAFGFCVGRNETAVRHSRPWRSIAGYSFSTSPTRTRRSPGYFDKDMTTPMNSLRRPPPAQHQRRVLPLDLINLQLLADLVDRMHEHLLTREQGCVAPGRTLAVPRMHTLAAEQVALIEAVEHRADRRVGRGAGLAHRAEDLARSVAHRPTPGLRPNRRQS